MRLYVTIDIMTFAPIVVNHFIKNDLTIMYVKIIKLNTKLFLN